MKRQMISGVALVMCGVIGLTGCAKQTTLNTETSAAICDAWETSLFWPSRQDTHETAVGLNDQHEDHAAACLPAP